MLRIRFNYTPTPDPTERHQPEAPRIGFKEIRDLEIPEGQIADAKETGMIELLGASNAVKKYLVDRWRYIGNTENGMTDGLEMDITDAWPAVIRPNPSQ